MIKPDIIFFGNGPLADYTLEALKDHVNILFHAKTKEDLEEVKHQKAKNPAAHGVLASYGVLIKQDVLDIFEPEGILNLHPSLLPKYRGASPIESAILNGDTEFGVSIMKLVKAMDAGPIYYQNTLTFNKTTRKFDIYQALAKDGTTWLIKNLTSLPTPTEQPDAPTFTTKLDKSMSELKPFEKSADILRDEVRAFEKFPKSKYTFFNQDCTIISVNVADTPITELDLKCKDGKYLIIQELQPAGRKIMDAKSFLNGYKK